MPSADFSKSAEIRQERCCQTKTLSQTQQGSDCVAVHVTVGCVN